MALIQNIFKKKIYCTTCGQRLDEHNTNEFRDGYYCNECAKKKKEQTK